MVWQRFAKPPGESLCRFDSCHLRHLSGESPIGEGSCFENSRRVAPGSSNLSLSAFEPVAQRIRALASEARGSQVQIPPGSFAGVAQFWQRS